VQQNVRTLFNQAAQADAAADGSAGRLGRLQVFAEHRASMRKIDLAGVAEQACVIRDPERYYSPAFLITPSIGSGKPRLPRSR
jgi:hypothetical protein